MPNNYDQHASLPKKCGLARCSKELLLQEFRKLQLKYFHRNYDIPIRNHEKNTLRVATYNLHFWQDAGVKVFSESNNAASKVIGELVAMDADMYL